MVPIRRFPEKVTVWCAISSHGVLGPYYYEQNGQNVTVNGTRYYDMLRTKFIPDLFNFCLQHDLDPLKMWFQQDGARPHIVNSVRQYLQAPGLFGGRTIGQHLDHHWPARSPDLTVCDFFLWGYLKRPLDTGHHNHGRITAELRQITADHGRLRQITADHDRSRQITADHGSSRQITADHGRSRQFTADHGRSRQITADHSRSRQITAEHGRLRQITADYGRSRQITAEHGRSQQFTADHGRSQQITAYHGRLRQITAEHGSLRQNTADHGRSRQITADHGRLRQITADYGRSRQITADH